MSDEKNKPNFLLNLKQGGTVDPVKLVASRPYAAAIASKLVTSRDEILGSKARRRQATTAEAGQLDKVTKDLIYHTEDNENIQLMFPDIKLAQQIVVSSIVSPKDMVQPHLNYDCRKKEIPAQIRIGLLDTTKRHFEDGYFILDRLYKVVDETLFHSVALCVFHDGYVAALECSYESRHNLCKVYHCLGAKFAYLSNHDS
jgi:hypothetical protein